jgi:hypothetical protein
MIHEGISVHSSEVLSEGQSDADRLAWSRLAPGDTVGPYHLIHAIGYGGTSSVWLAQPRDGQLKREVALKLPLLGPHMQLERFMRERDILAALTHPGIARLYDAGISESGQPYLAMEYVCGKTLTRTCDERCLTVGDRLGLFLQVLQAVQFAHAELIIHRDLKPSNTTERLTNRAQQLRKPSSVVTCAAPVRATFHRMPLSRAALPLARWRAPSPGISTALLSRR